MKKLPIALLLALGVSSFSYAAEVPDLQMKAFQKAVRALTPKIPDGNTRQNESRLIQITTQIQQAQAGSSDYVASTIEQNINSLVSNLNTDAELSRTANELIKALRDQNTVARAKITADMDAILAKAGAACLAAQKLEDLDPTIAVLRRYSNGYSNNTGGFDETNWQRGTTAYRFVISWQDYLNLKLQDRVMLANNALMNLTQNLDVALMPRSRILALIQPVDDANAQADSTAQRNQKAFNASIESAIPKIEQAKTSDDLVAIIRSLNTRSSSNYNQPAIIAILAGLVEDRQQVVTGSRPAQLFTEAPRKLAVTDPAYSTAGQIALLNFRRETQFLAIRKTYPDAKLPDPSADETPEAFSLRVVDYFVQQDNWQRVRDALEFHRASFGAARSNGVGTNNDVESVSAYLAARNLDAAGQYAAAITNYQRALRLAGQQIPVKAIADRLTELKKSQPDAFSGKDVDPVDSTPVRISREATPGMPSNTPYTNGPSFPRSTARPPAPTGPMPTPISADPK